MDKNKENICIIYPNKSSSSETFIEAHVKNIPCNVHVLYGGWFPTSANNDVPLSSFLIWKLPRFIIKILTIVFGISFTTYVNRKSLLCFIEKMNIKAVMAEYGPTGVAVMDVCEEAGIPLIVHFHGFDAYINNVLEEYKEKYREMFSKAAALIAVSTHMKQQLLAIGAPFEKIYYNTCGVDVKQFNQGKKQVKEPLFLCVGRFVNKKAPHLAIMSFSYVLKEIPSAKLIMIGDGGLGSSGELYFACKQLVSALRLNHAVEFRGSTSNKEVAEAMKSVSIFIQHSVRPENGDSEGTPVAVLEACASSLPVVATKHGGINDVIIDGETGYLVNEYDIHAMAARMILLAQNPELAHKLGTAARKRIAENYSMEKSISNLWAIIQNSINVSNASS